MTTRKVTLPFPDYNFKLDCNHLPEVRQWLQDNGVRWVHGKQPTEYGLEGRYSWIKSRKLYGRGLTEWLNTEATERLPLITEQMLFEPILTNEQVFVLFLEEHRKFAEFKRLCGAYPLQSSYTCTSVIVEFIALITSNPYTSHHVPFQWRTFLTKWSRLHDKWQTLCDQFNLTGTIHIPTVISMR